MQFLVMHLELLFGDVLTAQDNLLPGVVMLLHRRDCVATCRRAIRIHTLPLQNESAVSEGLYVGLCCSRPESG